MSDYSIKITTNATEVANDFDDLGNSVKKSGQNTKVSIAQWQALNTVLSGLSSSLRGLDLAITIGQKNRADSLTLSHREELAAFELLWKEKLTLDEHGYSKQQLMLEKQYDDGLLNFYEYQQQKLRLQEEQALLEEEMANEKLALEQKQKQEKNSLDEKSFKNQKAFNLADAFMNTARSITAIWSSYSALGPVGLVLAPIQTAAVTAIGAAQIAAISAQQFVPAYAMGTNFHQGGMALVGEQGPELVNLPRGTVVNTADVTKNMLTASPTINITVNGAALQDKELANTIAREVSNIFGRSLKGGSLL